MVTLILKLTYILFVVKTFIISYGCFHKCTTNTFNVACLLTVLIPLYVKYLWRNCYSHGISVQRTFTAYSLSKNFSPSAVQKEQ